MTTTFTYTAPTTNTDGSPISPVQKYQIGYGPTSKNYTTISDDLTIEAGASQTTVVNVPVGAWFAAARDVTKDNTSAWSNEVSFTVAAPVPSAPTNFTAG